MRKAVLGSLLAAVLWFAVLSCSDGTTIVAITPEGDTIIITVVDSVTFVGDTLVLEVGDSASLAATTDTLGQTIDIDADWSSSNESVATVSTEGVIRGVGVGDAVITGTFENSSATLPVMVVEAGRPTIQTSTLDAAVVGESYADTLRAVGGTPTYTWNLVAGTLPAGIGLGSGGVLSGTASATDTVEITVEVVDQESVADTATFDFMVLSAPPPEPPEIITTQLATGIISTSYADTLEATGGAPPYTWSLLSGTLTSGLDLDGGGVLSGTPTATDTTEIDVVVTDQNNLADTASFTLRVTTAPTAVVEWACDFGTATGLSNTAVNDGGCWLLGPSFSGSNNLEVVVADAEGIGATWPSTNALEVKSVNPNGGLTGSRMIWSDTASIPNAVLSAEPRAGESVYFRWYGRVHQPDSVNRDQQQQTLHPIQDLHSGAPDDCAISTGCNWGTQTFTDLSYGAGMYRHQWPLSRFTGATWAPPDLPKDSTHRFELQIRIVSTNPDLATVHARIYRWRAGGEVLVYDDNDMRDTNSSATFADSTVFDLPAIDKLGTLQAGTNGFAERTSYDFDFMYQGAFAVCLGDWCGAYRPGEGGGG